MNQRESDCQQPRRLWSSFKLQLLRVGRSIPDAIPLSCASPGTPGVVVPEAHKGVVEKLSPAKKQICPSRTRFPLETVSPSNQICGKLGLFGWFQKANRKEKHPLALSHTRKPGKGWSFLSGTPENGVVPVGVP